MNNKTILNQDNILKRNYNKLKKLYREALEYEEFKSQKQKENMNSLFKSIQLPKESNLSGE